MLLMNATLTASEVLQRFGKPNYSNQIENFARHYMWLRRGCHTTADKAWYAREAGLTPKDFNPDPQDYKCAEYRVKVYGSTAICKDYDMEILSLDNCVPTPIVKPYCKQQEKEGPMYGAQAVTLNIPSQETYDPLKYILYRLEDMRDKKLDELQEKFHTNGMRPKTVKELKEWLKKGYYYVDTPKNWDEDTACYSLEFFNWGEKPDLDGYEAVKEKLNEAYYAVIDLVKIKTDEDTRLKALQDFQAATFH